MMPHGLPICTILPRDNSLHLIRDLPTCTARQPPTKYRTTFHQTLLYFPDFPPPYVKACIRASITFDSCHTQGHSPVFVGAAKAATVPPRCILVVVNSPRYGPVVASWSLPFVSGPVESNIGNNPALWIWAGVCARATADENTKESRSAGKDQKWIQYACRPHFRTRELDCRTKHVGKTGTHLELSLAS